MIDHFGPHHVLTADDERMSEIEQAFEVVRGGQLHWLFSLALSVYRLLTYPKLAGEWHLEAEEIRRSSGGFQPRGSWKLHTLYSSFALSFRGASVRIGELTVPKPRKITRDNTKNKDKLTLFIWLSLSGLWGWNVTICDIYENFSGSLASCRDRLLPTM